MPKQTKQQKSVSLILFICIVLFSVIGIGMSLMNPQQTHPAQANTCQYDPDVCKFFANLEHSEKYYPGSFTATITTSQKETITAIITVKSDGKDNLSIASYKKNVLQGEMSIFADSTYVRDPQTNAWTLSPTPADSKFRNFKQKALTEVYKTGTTASYVFIRGVPCEEFICMKYQRILSKTDPVKTYIFFDTKQHVLRQVQTRTPDGTLTDTVFSYKPVTINKPVIN